MTARISLIPGRRAVIDRAYSCVPANFFTAPMSARNRFVGQSRADQTDVVFRAVGISIRQIHDGIACNAGRNPGKLIAPVKRWVQPIAAITS